MTSMLLSTKLISILLPTYNAMPYLREAVDSIIAQTVTDWQLVIVDDGSTDETWKCLSGLRGQLGPRLTVLFWAPNRGIATALNKGIEVCNGLYIARMDADDIALPHRLERQLAYLEAHPQLDGCGCWIEYFGEYSQEMTLFPERPEEVREKLREFTTVPHPTYFFRRKVYEQCQYDPSYPRAEDVEFLRRVTSQFQIGNVPEILLRYRTGPAQASRREAVLQNQCVERIWREE